MTFLPASVRAKHDRENLAVFKAMKAADFLSFPERTRPNLAAGICPICALDPTFDAHVPAGEGREDRVATEWHYEIPTDFHWVTYHLNSDNCWAKHRETMTWEAIGSLIARRG